MLIHHMPQHYSDCRGKHKTRRNSPDDHETGAEEYAEAIVPRCTAWPQHAPYAQMPRHTPSSTTTKTITSSTTTSSNSNINNSSRSSSCCIAMTQQQTKAKRIQGTPAI